MYRCEILKNILDRDVTIKLEFDIADKKIDGKAQMLLKEQGWDVKVPGTISGTFDPVTNTLSFETAGLQGKYSGMDYQIQVTGTGTRSGESITADIAIALVSYHRKDRVTFTS